MAEGMAKIVDDHVRVAKEDIYGAVSNQRGRPYAYIYSETSDSETYDSSCCSSCCQCCSSCYSSEDDDYYHGSGYPGCCNQESRSWNFGDARKSSYYGEGAKCQINIYPGGQNTTELQPPSQQPYYCDKCKISPPNPASPWPKQKTRYASTTYQSSGRKGVGNDARGKRMDESKDNRASKKISGYKDNSNRHDTGRRQASANNQLRYVPSSKMMPVQEGPKTYMDDDAWRDCHHSRMSGGNGLPSSASKDKENMKRAR